MSLSLLFSQFGRTPLQLAREKSNKRVAVLLEAAQAESSEVPSIGYLSIVVFGRSTYLLLL